ncbi:MAG: peptidylprolyl isomerase [Oscillospiraceae bacterium]|nr:peptidylprolyl isomerase [Oscillospiraceae bacterium]
MSASSKKKLRAAENAEKLTEKQLAEQKEAKKLKIMTAAFVIVVALAIVIAAYTGITRGIANSGIRERNTIAMTVNGHEINNVEMNYFFIDAVNQFFSQYGSYATMFGLDTTKPLDEQYIDEEKTTTWSDDFMNTAAENAKTTYALIDAAKDAGHTLTAEEQNQVNNAMSYMMVGAMQYGYADTESYIKAMYGPGATEETLEAYFNMTALADSYYAAYAEALEYTDAELRAAEAENFSKYSAYSYNYYYLSTSKFQEGGTTAEDGTVTYSAEEKAAAAAAAEEVAKELASGEYASIDEFDAAIAALSVNADVENASSSSYVDNIYSGVSSLYADWVTDDTRVEGDTHYVASTSTSTNDDGTETTNVNGYYIVYYVGSNDNTFALANVRHILVAFEGGTYNSTTGMNDYTDEEKAAALEEAKALLAEWEAGEATEDSFAALANEKSDDGDGTTGGLYTDVYPGQMVTNFNDWCFAEEREVGDYEIVETEYGYHIIFYSGDSETTYRDHLIKNDLISADLEEWYTALIEATTAEVKDTSYVTTDLILNAQ